MAEPIYRQKTQGLERRTQRAKASARTIDRTPAATQVTDTSYGVQVLNSIINAAGAVTTKIGMDMQKRIENDKVKQLNQALRGAAPTDDATEAGYLAHSVVGLQNKVLTSSTRLRSEAASFTGTDEEWDNKVSTEFDDIQTSMYAEYPQVETEGGKQDFLGHITNAFNEQMPQLAMAREAGKLSIHHNKRVSDFTDNLLLRSKELNGEELSTSLNGLLTDGRASLQLTGQETDDILVNAALNAVKQGDDRLLTFTETYNGDGKTSLMDRDGKLQTARSTFDTQSKMVTEGAKAQVQADLIDRFNSGDLTFTQLTAESDSSGAFSAAKLIALRKSKQVDTVKKVDVSANTDLLMTGGKEGSDVLGVTIASVKAQQPIIAEAQSRIDEQNAQILNRLPDGGTAEQKTQVERAGNKQLAELMAKSQFTNTKWKESLDSLQTFNLENADMDGEMPANAQKVIDLWRTMPEGSQLDHASPKTAAMMANMEMFERQGKSPIQALALSQKSIRYSKPIDAATRTEFYDASDDIADEISDGSWLPYDGATDAYSDRFRAIMREAVMVNLKAGYTSAELAARDAGAAFEKYYTRTGKGQLLFGDVGTITKQMAVHAGDIDLTLDTYMKMNEESLVDAANGGTLDEMYYDVIPNRGTVVIRNIADGSPLTSPIPLSDLKVGRDEFNKNATSEANRIRTEEQNKLYERDGTLEVQGVGKEPTPVVDTIVNQAENEPEEKASFETAMMGAENSTKAGRSQEGAWSPHSSLEGGTKTLAFGHKLKSFEVTQGYVTVGEKRYSFREGESEITDSVAKLLLKQDLDDVDYSLSKKWKGYNELPNKYKRVLQNLDFNAGISKSNWPKLVKAMEAGDDATVREEMVTKYTDTDGNDVGLRERAKAIADAVGLK